MNAVQYVQQERRLELVRKPIPKISNLDDVLIRILYAGICKSDVHIIDSGIGCNKDKPIVLGREISGVVVNVGAQVLLFKPFDKVTINPYSTCQMCDYCRSGMPHLCLECRVHNTFGVYKDGGWADYIVVPQLQVYKLPEKLPIQLAVLSEKISAIAYVWRIIGPVNVNQRVLVLGAGLKGILWIVMLHYQGLREVTISEPNLARHEYIQRMNINYQITAPNMFAELQTNGYYFDVIIDCSSSPKAIEQAFPLLNSGGKLCIFNKLPSNVKIRISPYEIQRKHVTVIGASIGAFNFLQSLSLLQCLCNSYLNYEDLGVKMYSIKDYKDAVNHVRKGSVLKAVFRLSDDCKCCKLL